MLCVSSTAIQVLQISQWLHLAQHERKYDVHPSADNCRTASIFGLAKHLILSDGKMTDREDVALRQIERETGMTSDGILPTDASDVATVAVLLGRRARVATLLELLGIAYADDEYHPGENEMIKSVAAALGVTDNEVLQMENWVLRQMVLAAEARSFFEGED